VVQGYRVCFLSQVDLLLTMFASTVCMQALMDLIILVQNLLWSGTKFLESCDEELFNKIKECTKSCEFMEKTGPVYFCVALEMKQSSAEAVLCRHMLLRLSV